MKEKLKKAQKIHFYRETPDMFICMLTDADDNVLQTFEPREVFEGESYNIDFGYPVVFLGHVFEDSFPEMNMEA